MTGLKGRIPTFWHLVGLMLVGSSITGLVFFQLFVDQFGRPMHRTEVFKSETWRRMARSLFRKPPAEGERVFWEQEFLSPQKDKLTWIQEPNTLVILDLTSDKIVATAQLPKPSQIIQWSQDNESVFVAQRETEWSIVRLFPDRQEVVRTGIAYPHDRLTLAAQPIAQYLVFPDCAQICRFGILDLMSGEAKWVAALREDDPDARLENLVMQFFDEQQKLIAYQRTPGAEPYDFFVINFQQELVQLIELRLPSGWELEFAGYYPQSQEMAFVSDSETDADQEFLLYSAMQPALRLLDSLPKDQPRRKVTGL